jgi:CheY-like chemotaxis protein
MYFGQKGDSKMTVEIAPTKITQLLLVEDSDTDFLLLEWHVQKMLAAIQVTRAANREELIASLQHDYDLIITDFHLPGAEGEALLTLITNAQRKTPCLLLSGSSDELNGIQTPVNVLAKIEKGDHQTLRAALREVCVSNGIPLKNS